MVDLFARAKTAPATKTAAKKKSDKKEFNISGLSDLSTIDALMETLEAHRAAVAAKVKSQMKDQFVELGNIDGKRPANFRGVDGDASASCELKKRSSVSKLSDEEVEMLDDAGISYEKAIVVQEAFLINPAYASDQALMDKVSKALEKVPGLPGDFIQFQAEVSKNIVTDESMDQVFKNGVADELLDIVSVLSVKPAASTSPINEVIEKVEAMLGLSKKGK